MPFSARSGIHSFLFRRNEDLARSKGSLFAKRSSEAALLLFQRTRTGLLMSC